MNFPKSRTVPKKVYLFSSALRDQKITKEVTVETRKTGFLNRKLQKIVNKNVEIQQLLENSSITRIVKEPEEVLYARKTLCF